MSHRTLVATLLFVMLFSGNMLIARDAWAQSRKPQYGKQLEEVVVTARRRQENLQTTPVAVSAFSGKALNMRNVTSIDKLSEFTPNLVIRETPTNSGVTSAAVYIRGIGQDDFVPSVDPGVGIYVDGVYLGRTVGAVLDLLDIKRVEILRGPQGTLFGRNTIGGAVSVTMNKPNDKFGGKVDAKFGTDARRNFRGTVNVPITDNFFMRFSGASFQQDGYVKRPYDNKKLGDENKQVGRVEARWLPTSNLEFNFSIDYTHQDENGPAMVVTGIQPLPSGSTSMASTQNAVESGLGNPVVCFLPANANNPLCYNQQWISSDHKTNYGTAPAYAKLNVYGTAMTVDWHINDQLKARSITAYRGFDGNFFADRDASPLIVNETRDIYQQKQFSQELQFLGTNFDGRLKWIAGFYYFKEDGKNLNPVRFSAVQLQSGGYFHNQSWALYGQGTYDITNKLALTFGMRYTEDDKNFLPDQYITLDPVQTILQPILGFDPTPFNAGERVVPYKTVSRSTKKWIPMVNLAYTWRPGLMTYFTYSEGFKSGGFTQRIFPPEPSLPSFGPEYVTSYELGLKYEGWEKRLRLNMAGYYTNYTNQQLLVADPSRVGPYITNAGDAEIKGMEIEMSLIPAEDWYVTGSVGYTDPKRTRLQGGVQGLTLNSRFEQISKWNADMQVQKDIGLGEWGKLTPRFEWVYRSGYGTNDNNIPRNGAPPGLGLGVANPALYQPGYHLFNASLRWDVKSTGFAVTGGVDNLTDKKYRTYGDFQDSFGMTDEIFSRGRQWYITLSYGF